MNQAAFQIVAKSKCIILDFDGVIADSEQLQLDVWRDVLADYGLQSQNIDLCTMVGLMDDERIKIILPHRDLSLYEQLVQEKIQRCREKIGELRPVPGANRFLESIHLDKIVLICSSSPRERIIHFLSRFFPHICFAGIVCDGNYRRHKPFSDPYELAIKLANVDSTEALAIEDSWPGISSATGAGINVLHLNRYCQEFTGIVSIKSLYKLAEWKYFQ